MNFLNGTTPPLNSEVIARKATSFKLLFPNELHASCSWEKVELGKATDQTVTGSTPRHKEGGQAVGRTNKQGVRLRT